MKAPHWKNDIVSKLIEKQGGKHCGYCKIPLELGDRFEIDHIWPVSKGGSNELKNLLMVCYECNRLKKNLDLGDFEAMLRNKVNEAQRFIDKYGFVLEYGAGK